MPPVKSRYRIEGMDCSACATKIETAARRMGGVAQVSVSLPGRSMVVDHTEQTDLGELVKRVEGLGYRVSPLVEPVVKGSPPAEGTGAKAPGHTDDAPQGRWWMTTKGRYIIATGLAAAAAYVMAKLVPGLGQWPFAVAMLVGLVPIARRAIMAALAGTPFSIEMLMTIAAVGAVFIGAAQEAAAVVFLFLIGELLEGVAAGRARASIQALTKLVPKTAFLKRENAVEEVPADSLAVGDMILVRPGDRVPADGLIEAGAGEINEAPVTGESTPVLKAPGASVFAGTVNGDVALTVRVTAAAADNTIARVVKLVEEAQESKAPTERFIDRFSRYYTPGVVVVALLVATVPPLMFGSDWNAWIYKGLAVLLIGCPCALVISTPAAIAASLSAGARRGLLMKGGAILERLGKTTLVAFDKTGTLTAGAPLVTDLQGFDISDEELVRYAAALETGSSHPLASAILAKATAMGVTPPAATEASAIGGKGVTGTVEGAQLFLGSAQAASEQATLTEAQSGLVTNLSDQGKTVSILLRDGKVIGAIAMRDEPRPDAQTGLKRLQDAGIRTVMLTGDNARTAQAIGQQLGIEVRAGLMPQDKQRIVKEYQAEGFKVAKVGDGINDAPALAAADVGIAMGGGTDVALETAGAAALHARVSDVASMITLSKRTIRIIAQNIVIALGLKAVFLLTTILGLTGIWPAILADTGATVLVTLNALRLLQVSRT